LLVVSFGGPEGPDDVAPFLENVFRGLRVTDETKAKIAARYQEFGGVSPINAHTRAFIAAHGIDLPVYWGNRNWHPYLGDTMRRMAADGVERAIAYVTSTFSCYSGCRKYREDLYDAWAAVDGAPAIDKLRSGFNHPGFIAAAADRLRDALGVLDAAARARAKVLFTAHSLPESMARSSRYEAQLTEACRLVAEAVGLGPYELVYQSNNARYGGEPWLGPDIGEALAAARVDGFRDVIVMPIGFVCDHMEVVLDLDTVAAADARKVGVNMIRAATVGAHPRFVGMVRELIVERMSGTAERSALGALGPSHDVCPAGCCLSGRPGPPKPALCGDDAPPPRGADAGTGARA
jgi:ferrochelatase